MSFINKVKNFFYEDVDEEEEPKVQENKKKFNPFKKESEPEIKETKEEVVDVKQQANNDLSERELFRSERTFNFPMDLGEDIFDKEDTENSKTEEITYPKKEPVKEQTYTRSIYHNISKEEPKKEEKKHFKPSPVVSPVYGILDKNYTVDDVVEADKTKEFSFDKKIVDFDSVRNRAYKELDEELEKTMNNDIFYNLDEEEVKEDELQSEEPSVIITYDEIEENAPIEAEEVEFKIPEEEPHPVEVEPIVDNSIEEDEDISPDVKIEVPKRTRKNKAVNLVEETEKKDKKEKDDLFNLIDNMYNEDEEEEEE